MLGDLKKHSVKYSPYTTLLSKLKVDGQYRSALEPIRTTNCQEQSFQVLRHLWLNDQVNHRVEQFVFV
jgi:hypothetical protein